VPGQAAVKLAAKLHEGKKVEVKVEEAVSFGLVVY